MARRGRQGREAVQIPAGPSSLELNGIATTMAPLILSAPQTSGIAAGQGVGRLGIEPRTRGLKAIPRSCRLVRLGPPWPQFMRGTPPFGGLSSGLMLPRLAGFVSTTVSTATEHHERNPMTKIDWIVELNRTLVTLSESLADSLAPLAESVAGSTLLDSLLVLDASTDYSWRLDDDWRHQLAARASAMAASVASCGRPAPVCTADDLVLSLALEGLMGPVRSDMAGAERRAAGTTAPHVADWNPEHWFDLADVETMDPRDVDEEPVLRMGSDRVRAAQ